ncbi:hypothetical protein, partial [Facilibium subflavum]|uniref:hypothetical protein n=1 Tax=Facilibium subflavum TaxID=2219058 RepID=UPI001AACAFBA
IRYFSQKTHLKQKIGVVSIFNSFFHSSHQKNIISELKNGKKLPFSDILSVENIRKHLQTPQGRDRLFTPEVTLWKCIFIVFA